MKRKELLKRLAAIAEEKGMTLELVRHGGNHDLFRVGGYTFPVARHSDVPELTARGTIRKVAQQ